MGVALDSFPMKRHLKSRNPALNVPRRHEPVATVTIFSDTAAVDSGVKQAQVSVGRDSGDYVNRSQSILDILDETPQISPIHNLLVNKHVFQQAPIDYEKLRPYFV